MWGKGILIFGAHSPPRAHPPRSYATGLYVLNSETGFTQTRLAIAGFKSTLNKTDIACMGTERGVGMGYIGGGEG